VAQVQDREGHEPDVQRLWFAGQELLPSGTVSDYLIHRDDTIQLMMPPSFTVSASAQAVTVRGSAMPGAAVGVRVDGGAAETVLADGTGAWSLVRTLAPGSHQVRVMQSTTLGQASFESAAAAITVDGAPSPSGKPAPSDGELGRGPVISRLTARSRCVVAASASRMSFSFELSRAATVTYVLARRSQSPARRSCPRIAGRVPGTYRELAPVTSPASAGTNAISLAPAPVRARAAARREQTDLTLKTLTGGRALRPGTYILVVRAVDEHGRHSAGARVKFFVLRPGRAPAQRRSAAASGRRSSG
jgi:hypothetical protein